MATSSLTLSRRRGARAAAVALVVGAAGLAGVATATPAFAKSTVETMTSTHTARVGQAIKITGIGGDDTYGEYQRVCVRERVNHQAWHWKACGKIGFLQAPNAVYTERMRVRGVLHVQTVLEEGTDLRHHLRITDFSPVVNVVVR
jgi:hypothetical protein